MPASNSNPKANKKHWTGSVLSILGGILILIGLAYWIVGGGSTMSEQKKMESYLEKKYGKEFVVEKPVRKASGLGVEGYLEADAYIKNVKDLKFTIRDAYESLTDNYLGTLWGTQLRNKLEPTINEIIGRKASFNVRIVTNNDKLYIKNSEVISYEDAKLLSTNVKNIMISINVKSSLSSSKRDRSLMLDQLYDLVAILKKENGTSRSLFYETIDDQSVAIENDAMNTIKSKSDIFKFARASYQ